MRFADRGKNKGDVNPLILLYGPPGTGKTSLCQGLAQRISIRLNSTYKGTKLVQIKTATLLSKYYSESARQVNEIFTKIACLCQDDPEQFVCVLIDEVESIASSREFSIKQGESQDSLRATNALLTGLDRTRLYPNIIFLGTSNMLEALDSAFLDRCGLKMPINPPSLTSQYEILRSRIQKLIDRKVIQSHEIIPPYDDAVLESKSYNTERPGCKLLRLVELVRSQNLRSQSEQEISGRYLKQLPEQSILRYLRSEDCDLDMALRFMEQLISSEYTPIKAVTQAKIAMDTAKDGDVQGLRKRKWKIVFEQQCDVDIMDRGVEKIKGQDASSSEGSANINGINAEAITGEIAIKKCQKFRPEQTRNVQFLAVDKGGKVMIEVEEVTV